MITVKSSRGGLEISDKLQDLGFEFTPNLKGHPYALPDYVDHDSDNVMDTAKKCHEAGLAVMVFQYDGEDVLMVDTHKDRFRRK